MMNQVKYNIEKFARCKFEVPKVYNSNHIILASFPKSGNTWVRFLLSNITNLSGEYYDEVTFHNIRYLSPEIRGNRELNGIKGINNFPIFLKTHFPYTYVFKKYKKVLLIRKPEDVMISYFIHLQEERGKVFSSFEKFLKHWRYGVPAWKYFHKSWLNKFDYILKYEDLIVSPEKEIKKLYKFFNIELDDDLLKKAIFLSRKDNMRKILQKYGDPMAKNKEFQFIRKATKGEGKSKLSKRDLEYIQRETNEIVKEIYEKILINNVVGK